MLIVILFILGLSLGSFVNAAVWRIHEQHISRKKSKSYREKLSIVNGRSMCPNCHHELAAMDLIPVISWLSLRGKCRYCHNSIGYQYPLVEIVTACLFLASYIFWPLGFDMQGIVLFAFWLLFLTGFMALAVYDLKWFLLPDRIVYPLMYLAAIEVLANFLFSHGSFAVITTAVWGFIIGGGLFYILFQISDGKWIGGGDVKLGFVIGLLVGGPLLSLMLLFIASLLGTLVALPMIILGKTQRSTLLPFGPFLIASAIIVYLFGASLLAYFRHTVLLY